MEFAKPVQYKAILSEKYYISENERFLYLKFELVSPDRIKYQAGQYVSLKINENGERRCYSIASTPDNEHGFHLLAEMVSAGKGSEYLKSLEIGSEIEALAPLGRFVISSKSANKLLFVATGSGIVPIYSMIQDLLINRSETREMRLSWGMRTEEDLFFVDNLERLASAHPNFVFDITLSKPSENWSLCQGYVQDCLSRDFGTQGGLGGWEAYLCGMPEKVVSIREKLVELGMKNEDIYHEKFA